MICVDALVIGASAAGSAFAAAAGRRGLSVVAVDRGNSRSVELQTLPAAARKPMEELGFLAEFESLCFSRLQARRSTWGTQIQREAHSMFLPEGLGWIIERNRFDAALRHVAEARGARIYTKTHVRSVERVGAEWVVSLDDTSVRAKLLIDATGRAAWLSRRLVAAPVVYDDLVAVIHRYDSLVRESALAVSATENGWFSTLKDQFYAETVFYTDADLNPRCAKGDVLTSARSQRALEICGSGWIAIGDAASAFDPLSSKGLLTALETALQATEIAMARSESERAERTATYLKTLESDFVRYLATRRLYYSMENRSSSFWIRRSRS